MIEKYTGSTPLLIVLRDSRYIGQEAMRHSAADEIERLRHALAELVAEIEEYERINNLSPSPGKQDCWQSVTRARALLSPT